MNQLSEQDLDNLYEMHKRVRRDSWRNFFTVVAAIVVSAIMVILLSVLVGLALIGFTFDTGDPINLIDEGITTTTVVNGVSR